MNLDIEFYKKQNEELRSQRNRYISELVDLKKKHRLEIVELRKRLDNSDRGGGMPLCDWSDISSLIYDLEACIDNIDVGASDKGDYGGSREGILAELQFVRDMLIANCKYFKRFVTGEKNGNSLLNKPDQGSGQ